MCFTERGEAVMCQTVRWNFEKFVEVRKIKYIWTIQKVIHNPIHKKHFAGTYAYIDHDIPGFVVAPEL